MQFGTILALALSGVLTDKINWESIFYVFGGLGIVWFGFWVLFVFDTPETHPRITKVLGNSKYLWSHRRIPEYVYRQKKNTSKRESHPKMRAPNYHCLPGKRC